MRKDLLERLADLLEADAANPTGVTFDMRAWAKRAGMVYAFKEGETVPVNCGTAACALGLAAISGAFEDEGLTYHILNERLVPFLEGYGDIEYDAAMKLFEIDSHAASILFDPSYYSRAQRDGAVAELEVVRRIRAMIAGQPLEVRLDGADD